MTIASPPQTERDRRTETQRAEFLNDLGILNGPAIPDLNALTQEAAAEFRVPIVLVTLIDSERQRIKSSVGFGDFNIPRDMAFCHHTIRRMRLLIVENTLDDPRFCNNPQVRNPPHIRFYAGAPLTVGGQFRIGGFCLLDDIPRRFEPEDGPRLWRYAEDAARIIERVFMPENLPGTSACSGSRK
ncbi:GAF domain-containing protein [Hyphomonas sp. NPDC076900]|uniref:GAF domain-containing protein n=1 Tax=unclassified Hyphomonas TaxID=2630699 RepID=UPI003D014373